MSNLLNITFEDIGIAFKEHGYITTDNNVKQYNNTSQQFDDVNEGEVLAIFKNVYPNFERRLLSIDLITKYLPEVTSQEIETYDLYRHIETEGKENIISSIASQIKDTILENDKRKDNDVSKFQHTDFESALQVLINQDVFTDGNRLYILKKKDFELIEKADEVKTLDNILVSYCMGNNSALIDYSTLIYQAKMKLTNISALKQQLKLKNQMNFTKEDMKAVNKIENLIKSYPEGDDV